MIHWYEWAHGFFFCIWAVAVARLTMVAKAKWTNESGLFESSGKWELWKRLLFEREALQGAPTTGYPVKTEAAKAKAKHMEY